MPAAQVRKGHFAVEIDADELGLPDNADETFLELRVCAPAPCSPTTLSPRSRVTHAALAVSSRALGGSARSEDDGTLSLRASQSGSALLRAAGPSAAVPVRLESMTSSDNSRTYMVIDDAAEEVRFERHEQLNRGGYTPAPSFTLGPVGGRTMSFFAGSPTAEEATVTFDGPEGPGTFRVNAGGLKAMEIDGETANATFFGAKVAANEVQVGSVEANRAGVAARLKLSGNLNRGAGGDPQLDLLVGEKIVDRWSGFGATGQGQAANHIGGAPENTVADGAYGVNIGGGGSDLLINEALDNFAMIAGGAGHTADEFSAVAGGEGHCALGGFSFVGSGVNNCTLARAAGVTSGQFNEASGLVSTVTGGQANVASGDFSISAGGLQNESGGKYSFAAGHKAYVRNALDAGDPDGDRGTFVWADSTVAVFASTGPDQFLIRANGGLGLNTNAPDAMLHVVGNVHATGPTGIGMAAPVDGTMLEVNGGIRTHGDVRLIGSASPNVSSEAGNGHLRVFDPDGLVINESGGNVGIGTVNVPTNPLEMASGAYVSAGGTWTNASSRSLKENFEDVHPAEVLNHVLRLPIRAWNYKSDGAGVRHIGPIAEEFHERFSLGSDDKSISTIDADGVALAAIQGLHELVRERECEIHELRMQLSDYSETKERLARLEQLLKQLSSQGLPE